MLLAEQKRVYAKKCLEIALSGDLKSAARIRQQAYAISPPGSIGIDPVLVCAWQFGGRFVFLIHRARRGVDII